jgi:diguanylate cyclase (GGDEF)-like protein
MTETQLQASTDSLTGLLNRLSLEDRVQMLRRGGTSFVVAMADLDHFKQLNDVHGHETGDRALRMFAQTLRTSLRSNDVVCRQGGEEFAVVLPACTLADATVALEKVRSHLLDAIRGSGLPAFTVSFGIVEAADTEDLAEVLACRHRPSPAEQTGRDRVVVHDRHSGRSSSSLSFPRTRTNANEDKRGRVPVSGAAWREPRLLDWLVRVVQRQPSSSSSVWSSRGHRPAPARLRRVLAGCSRSCR